MSVWPLECNLCHTDMTSPDDRMEWHGLGNCVEICEECMGSGETINGSLCPSCKGTGSPEVKPEQRFPIDAEPQ
jgi:DnaJ-class molecular chaperone